MRVSTVALTDMFGNFVEMAEHLLHDAADVLSLHDVFNIGLPMVEL